MAGNTSTPGATVTSRLLAIVGAFDERHRSLSLSELAHRAGLPVPTAHRLAGELVAGHALQRREDGRFEVGRLLWDAGLLAPVEGRLRQVAEPFLHDVYAATMATVHLAVREGAEVLYLRANDGPHIGAHRQQRRKQTAHALHRSRQGPARPRTGGDPGPGVCQPDPGHALHNCRSAGPRGAARAESVATA